MLTKVSVLYLSLVKKQIRVMVIVYFLEIFIMRLAFIVFLCWQLVFTGDVLSAPLPKWQLAQLGSDLSFRGSASLGKDLWISGSNNSVFLSTDNGKTWLNRSPKLVKKYDFRDIEVLDSQTVVLMSAGSGDDSQLLISHDYGQSWQTLY